jgi:F-type H+-transporting ATPase subunit a
MEHAPTWFAQLFHVDPKVDHIASALLVVVLLVVGSILAYRAVKKAAHDPLPDGKLTVRNVFELAVQSLDNLVQDTMGHHHGRHFTPIIGTIFLFIFCSNLLGTIPGFLPPTSNVNTNIAVAIVVFFLTHYYGVKEHGAGYIKHFMGPVVFLVPLMLAIELVSHLVRPLSLTIRLYGNISGDHIVLNIFSNIWHTLGIHIPEVGIPVVFLLLGIFVSFVQAFVFSLLSMVYISGAMAHDH